MAETVEATIRKNVVTRKKDGVGKYGLYVDYIVYDTSLGRLMRQERFFLADRVVARYSRKRGDKRAAWRPYQMKDLDAAIQWMKKNIARRDTPGTNTQLVHEPLAIELTAGDIAAIEKGEAPYARYLGTTVTEKLVGKIDDDEWRAAEIVASEEPVIPEPDPETVPKPYSKRGSSVTSTTFSDSDEVPF